MIRAILTDIEGTTSSLSFVKDVLFPYARVHLAAFVREHAQDPFGSARHEAGAAGHQPTRARAGLDGAIIRHARLVVWLVRIGPVHAFPP